MYSTNSERFGPKCKGLIELRSGWLVKALDDQDILYVNHGKNDKLEGMKQYE